MSKKKLIALCASLTLVATIGIGTTLAYFTDQADTANTFTMGHVDIKLYETDDNDETEEVEITESGLTFEEVLPSLEYAKDPTIEIQTGSADCYIRVNMVIEKIGDDNTITSEDLTALETALRTQILKNTKWTYAVDANNVGYYYFADKLSNDKANEVKTAVLFDRVTIPKEWGNNTADQQFTIKLYADAVQADGFTPTTDWANLTVQPYTAPVAVN